MSRPTPSTTEEKRLARALPDAVLMHGTWTHRQTCAACGQPETRAVTEWRVADWESGDVLAVAATPAEAVSRAVFLWGKHKRRASP